MICFNGKIVNENDFKLSYNNRYFIYGDGFFETIKVKKGQLVYWNDHYFRIMGSLCMLRMPIPSYFNSDFLRHNILTLLKSNQLDGKSSRIRIIFFRNSDGFYLPKNKDFSYVISSEPLDSDLYCFNEKGLKVDVFNQYKLGTCELNNLKTTNRIINVLASIYTKENSLDDSIILNEKNNIVEFTSGNLFLILDGQLITPPLSSGCINGIIRKKILGFNNFLNFKIIEKDIKKNDLINAEELFSTNVISGLSWVSSLRDKKYNNKYTNLIIEKINSSI